MNSILSEKKKKKKKKRVDSRVTTSIKIATFLPRLASTYPDNRDSFHQLKSKVIYHQHQRRSMAGENLTIPKFLRLPKSVNEINY